MAEVIFIFHNYVCIVYLKKKKKKNNNKKKIKGENSFCEKKKKLHVQHI